MKTIDILKAYIKFGTKLLHLNEKNKGNLRQVIRKLKKMVNLRVLRVNPYVSKGVPQSCLNPNTLSFFFTIVFPKFLSINYSFPLQFFL
jgi:hypothetical protein